MNRSLPFDWQLAPYDVLQSQAHARGLARIGVMTEAEAEEIAAGLDRVLARIEAPGFAFEESDEDIHMAIERLLGEEVGAVAGKLHTGRSRNDQVATDIAMVVKRRLARGRCGSAARRWSACSRLAETHADWPMPGYTHLQRAQPVYLGHHLLAYFWMLSRDARRFAFAAESAQRDAARLRRPGGRQLADRPRASSPPSSASPGSPRTRSTAPPTATSSSTT